MFISYWCYLIVKMHGFFQKMTEIRIFFIKYNLKEKITIINMKEHPHSASSLSLSHLCISVSFQLFLSVSFGFLIFLFWFQPRARGRCHRQRARHPCPHLV